VTNLCLYLAPALGPGFDPAQCLCDEILIMLIVLGRIFHRQQASIVEVVDVRAVSNRKTPTIIIPHAHDRTKLKRHFSRVKCQ
jgi:hypothetical protein